MSKKIFTGIILIMFGLSQVSNAQITLEHTFDGDVSYFGTGALIGNNTGVNLYGFVNTTTSQVKLYNEDYSLYKSVTITPPSGYKIDASISCISKTLFNSNDKIEFIVTFTRSSTLENYNDRSACKMYDEDGTLIKDFGTSYVLQLFGIIKLSNGEYKLLIKKYIYDSGTAYYNTNVYSIPGTITTAAAPLIESNNILQLPYPNPASSVITLPYQLKQGETSVMNIYNINGQLIENKQIDSMFDKILLNVSSYAKGMYIYEVNGISSRFIVE
jgi:hypothetical protein